MEKLHIHGSLNVDVLIQILRQDSIRHKIANNILLQSFWSQTIDGSLGVCISAIRPSDIKNTMAEVGQRRQSSEDVHAEDFVARILADTSDLICCFQKCSWQQLWNFHINGNWQTACFDWLRNWLDFNVAQIQWETTPRADGCSCRAIDKLTCHFDVEIEITTDILVKSA